MATITCPDCGQVTEIEALRRGADEFCAHCDYPLFWARVDGPALVPDAEAQSTRRRLPGTAGRLTVGHRPCPVCAEQNPMSRTTCVRCGSLLDPPPPEPVVEPPPPAPPPPEPEPVVIVQKRPWWPWVVLAVVVVAIVVALVIAL